jgi:hypothetical protein
MILTKSVFHHQLGSSINLKDRISPINQQPNTQCTFCTNVPPASTRNPYLTFYSGNAKVMTNETILFQKDKLGIANQLE